MAELTAGRRKVMLVDDDDSVVMYLQMKLARHYEIVKTTEPRDGLALARSEQPDLVLCDIDMPTMSGIVLADALAKDPLTARIPVVHLTALVSAHEAHMLDTIVGGRPFVAKRAPVPELLAKIESVLAAVSSGRATETDLGAGGPVRSGRSGV